MRSLIISRSMDVVTGLRLAGIEGKFVKNSEELLKEFRANTKRDNIGILILTEEDFKDIEKEVIALKLKKGLPLVVTIPGRGGLKDKDLILRYVKESVGVKLS